MASNFVLWFSPSMISRDSSHVYVKSSQSLDREVVHVVCIGNLQQPVRTAWDGRQNSPGSRARRPLYLLG